MLRALQAVVLGHAVEELRMLNDEVVDALDVAHLQLVLDDDGVQLNELQPAQPCRVPAHGIREQRVEDLEAVSSTRDKAHKKREERHERVEERSGRKEQKKERSRRRQQRARVPVLREVHHLRTGQGDKLIEEHAGKMTKRHFSTTYTGLPWNKVYKGRMRNGKKTIAKECVPPFLPPSLPPSIQLTDHACDALSPSIPA